MPSISRINGQLKCLAGEIEIIINSLPNYTVEEVGVMATVLERLTRAQKALVETQVAIFIEATESDLDMPVLPLFVEDRDSDPEGWGEDGEPETE